MYIPEPHTTWSPEEWTLVFFDGTRVNVSVYAGDLEEDDKVIWHLEDECTRGYGRCTPEMSKEEALIYARKVGVGRIKAKYEQAKEYIERIDGRNKCVIHQN